MDNMINLIRFETEDFTEPATDLIEEDHAFEGVLTIVLGIVLASGNYDRVEIVVAKFTGIMALDGRVVPEDGSVGVPLSDGRTICHNSFLSVSPHF